ncbi:MAG: ATP-binding protein [Thermostichus sp. BF3_bins_97]
MISPSEARAFLEQAVDPHILLIDSSDILVQIAQQFAQVPYALMSLPSGQWGILSEGQLYRQWGRSGFSRSLTAAELTWDPVLPIVLPTYSDPEALLAWMQQQGIPYGPVLDGSGHLLGGMRREHLQHLCWQWAHRQAQTCRQLLENSPDVIERFDLNLRHLYVSGELSRLSGIPAEQMMGKTCREVGMSEAMVTTWEAAAQAVIASGEGRTIEFATNTLKGIRTFEMTISPERDAAGKLESLLCISRDITERQQMETALKESQQRFQNLVANIPGAVFQYVLHPDQTDQVTYMSPGCFQLWELDAKTVEENASPLWQMVLEEDRPAMVESVLHSAQTLEPWHWSWRILTPSGQLKWLEAAGQPHRLINGDVLWDTMILDVTARKTAEQALREQLAQSQLLNQITQAIRDSLEIDVIFRTASAGIGQLIPVDRVAINQYLASEGLWQCRAEYSRHEGMSLSSSLTIPDENNPIAALLKQGQVIRIDDTAAISDPVNQAVSEQFPGAWLILPIVIGSEPWGALSLYFLGRSYSWSNQQVELLSQVASQLGIAIQQSHLVQQLQEANEELRYQVNVRNQELQTMVNHEQLLRWLGDEIRSSLNEEDVLQATVSELAQVFQLSCCNINFFEQPQPRNASSTFSEPLAYRVAYEDTTSSRSFEGSLQTVNVHILPQLLHGKTLYFCRLYEPWQRTVNVVCSIENEQQILGFLRLMRSQEQEFTPAEIRLAKQVASQCAIGIRQARLHAELERQVQRLTELNQVKEDFLNLVSHELRTPLTSMRMAMKMMELSGIPDTQLRYFNILNCEWAKELELVNNLLDLQRLESGSQNIELSIVRLQYWIPVLLEGFLLRCQERQLNLSCDISPDLPAIYTDKGLLNRIVSELVNNAIKYTPPHEHIQVWVGQVQDSVIFKVINTGVQIPAEERSRVFDKFHRIVALDWDHQGGTGLGLPLVKKAVEALGGQVTLQSDSNGTCFQIELPLDPPQSPKARSLADPLSLG